MAENKKISELDQIQSLNDGDEFVVVDKSTTSGADASSGGKTTRVTLSQIKDAVSASGAKGATGATGSQGAQGAQGAQGPKGDQGSQGATGPKGDQGAQGAQGARGATGSAGSNGSTGAQGAQGARGATGSQGQKGQAGSNGSNGSTGARGATGSQGQKGVPGASIRGATGLKGAPGVGAKGQKGQAGSNGSNGSNGAKGQKGQGGSNGAKGQKGQGGSNGSNGAKGQKGHVGSGGQKGQKGLTGVGQKGAAGASGASISTSTTITPGQIKLNNSTNSRIDDEGSWGFRSRTNSGYIQFGPANSGHAHIYTDRANFYFNRELLVNGNAVYHSGNVNIPKMTGNQSAVVGPGWVTIADFDSNRAACDVYAWDNNSGRHSFIHIKASRQYTHASASVVSLGQYMQHVTAVRWLEKYQGTPTSPTVYGPKKLQIYLTHSVTLYTKLKMNTVFSGQTYVSLNKPVVQNSVSQYRGYGPAIPVGNGTIATTGCFVSGDSGLQMKTTSGKHGYVNTDGNGFTRVIGREAGVGLCEFDANGEIFRVHRETVSGNSITNAGENYIASVNRSHTNGNDESTLRIGRRFEMKCTGLMKGPHAANNHMLYMSNNSRFTNGTWKTVDKGVSTVFAIRDNGIMTHIADSVNAGASTIWRPSFGQDSNHTVNVYGKPGNNSADIFVRHVDAGKNSRVNALVAKSSGMVREPCATMQYQTYHKGAQLTCVSGNGSSAWHLSLSVQCRFNSNNTPETNPYRIVPMAYSEPTLGYSGQRFKAVYCASSSMTTSDKRTKDEIRELDEAEKNVAKKLKASMKMYKLKASIETKGKDNARLHCGVIAQDAIEIFKSENLDPFKYSVICHDIWYETMIDGEKVNSDKPKDGYERKEQYAVRYEELFAFIVSAL